MKTLKLLLVASCHRKKRNVHEFLVDMPFEPLFSINKNDQFLFHSASQSRKHMYPWVLIFRFYSRYLCLRRDKMHGNSVVDTKLTITDFQLNNSLFV